MVVFVFVPNIYDKMLVDSTLLASNSHSQHHHVDLLYRSQIYDPILIRHRFDFLTKES